MIGGPDGGIGASTGTSIISIGGGGGGLGAEAIVIGGGGAASGSVEMMDEGDGMGGGMGGGGGMSGTRWPRTETLALLRIRSEMDASFRDSSLKRPLWDEVSR